MAALLRKSSGSSLSNVLFGFDDDKLKLFFLRGVIFCLVPLIIVQVYYIATTTKADRGDDEGNWKQEVIRLLNHTLFLVFVIFSFIYVRAVGLTTSFKVVFMSYPFIFFLVDWINSTNARLFYLINLPLGVAPTLGNNHDAPLLKRVAFIELAAFIIVITLECVDLWTGDYKLNLHPWGRDDSLSKQWGIVWMTHVVPAVFMSFMLQNYAALVRKQEQQALHTVSVAFSIADKLANYDLEKAEELLKSCDYLGIGDVNMKKPFNQLLRNLATYKPFVPTALFKTDSQVTTNGESMPNAKLCQMLKGKETSWAHVSRAVDRMQDLNYALRDFHEDMTNAFPELDLYFEKNDHVDRGSTWMSSGITAADEFERTLGALYSVYCFLRLPIDGKEVFSYGIDEQGHPRRSPVGADSEKKRTFYEAMPWADINKLLIRADLLEEEKDKQGNPILKKERVTAMLTLTAIHDVMKNTTLLPVVQKKHAPYRGYTVGDQIGDHDVALEYILDRYPTLLPSFKALQPRQRAPILFTQGKMCFNNGWLVQGEAPPGALFTKFKQIIQEGCVSESDINFYFIHWLTDLAGAEPFQGRAWPGAEKLSARFPVKVLARFLESFSYVDDLATKSEVQVMERYLFDRWRNYGPFVLEHPECEVCAMRLALMAQGFEAEAVASFQGLSDSDRKTLAEEMAYTGCKDQFSNAPASLKSDSYGPALLIYYAPALLQKAKSAKCKDALCVLAAVFRASRRLFPLSKACAEETVIIRIDVLKVLNPEEIVAGAPWHVKRTSAVDAEASPGWGYGEKCAPIVLSRCDEMKQISL